MTDEVKGIHVSQRVGMLAIMARPRSKSHCLIGFGAKEPHGQEGFEWGCLSIRSGGPGARVWGQRPGQLEETAILPAERRMGP